MDASPSPVENVDALAEGVLAMLRTARGLVTGGRRIDLTGLDDMVGMLCAQALDLPPEAVHAVRPALARIGAELDLLTALLSYPA